MKKHSSRGFTLIELLVVVAIIAILSATILAALSAARNRARTSRIESEMASLRDQMELYYDAHGYYASAPVTDCTQGPFGASGGTDNASNLILGIASDTNGSGTNFYGIECAADQGSWAVSTWLIDRTTGWCVDSNGASKPGYTANPSMDFSAINAISNAFLCL